MSASIVLTFDLKQLLTLLDVVNQLDAEIIPYVIFLIVPVLGRMSDSNMDVRLLATETFATLVKLVPLEVPPVSFVAERSPAYLIHRECPKSYWPKGMKSANLLLKCSMVAKSSHLRSLLPSMQPSENINMTASTG